MMKRQLLNISTLATLACFTFVNIPPASAKLGHQQSPMRAFSQVDLSEQQKQEMRSIFTVTRENNSVFAGERNAIKQQMKDLMNMPSWDEASARSIITNQIEQGKSIALSLAKARNQAYKVLTEDQKLAFSINKPSKSKKDRKSYRHRIAKKLQLSDKQVSQIQAIDQATKLQMQVIADPIKLYRSQMRAITKAPSFDEDAWLALHNNALNSMVARKLLKTKAKYDKAAVLSPKQNAKLKNMMKKRQARRVAVDSIN
jgi:Spy/CpxP family protein refolding chaperone